MLLEYKLNPLKTDNYTLYQKLLDQQNLVNKLEKLEANNPNEFIELTEKVNFLTTFLIENKLRSHLFNGSDNKKKSVFINIIFLILLLPIHLFGLINNYLPYKIPVWIVSRKVKDLHFHSSIKMTLGVILFFFFWLIQFLIVLFFVSTKIGIMYLIALPIMAWINYNYWLLLLKTKGLWSFLKLKKQNKITAAKKSYDAIVKCVMEL